MTGIPSTILVAPESFKGTLGATEVAEAIGRGLQAEGHPVDLCPVADGGAGTLEVLERMLGVELLSAAVSDPLGRPTEARFGLLEERRGRSVAIVESAGARSLGSLAQHEHHAPAASTFGTGELIAAAIEAGAGLVYVGVGGSAGSDGGAGAIQALRARARLGGVELVVLGTRTAGGLAGRLRAAFGAKLVPGASFVLDALEFDRRMWSSRAVITGEARLDQQSLAGKALSEVATRSRQAGVPCHAIVGARTLDAFGTRVLDLQAVLEAATPGELEAGGRRLAELL